MNYLNISETTAHPLALYKNHLEFNGYQVTEEGDNLFCTHRRKMNLVLHNWYDRGVLVMSIFSCDRNVSKIELLEYINELNSSFLFMTAYLSDERDLILQTFFDGDYDRTDFSILLDNIAFDEDIFCENESSKTYIK
ncbi:MAG: hypothetical protein QNJ38_16160 [Prochloraceae cyanobacterium]|nr:hypothetical protein [Prochloraceae cyanobacterium]